MDIGKIKEAAELIRMELLEMGCVAERADHVAVIAPLIDCRCALNHALWMAEQILQMDSERLGKANRWLGNIQGVLWATGTRSIQQLKRYNMPDGVAEEAPFRDIKGPD